MSRDTFAFSSASLRSLRLEQELQDWEDARRALAHRRAMTRRPLPAAPRLRHGNERIQTVRAPPPQIRCRDQAIHNIFMCGDMNRVYAVLKDPGMVNALMETVHEEMMWAPEMGRTLIDDHHTHKQTYAFRCIWANSLLYLIIFFCRNVDSYLKGKADVSIASGCQQGALRLCRGAAV